MTSSELVGVIITPDAIRDKLVDRLLQDLLALGSINIVWMSRRVLLGRNDVIFLYPELIGREFFPAVINALTMGESVALLVQGESAFAKIRGIKGKLRLENGVLMTGGLRLKYRSWSSNEVRSLPTTFGEIDQSLVKRIFEFRIHTAENTTETARICHLYMGIEEVATLSDVSPETLVEVNRLAKEREYG